MWRLRNWVYHRRSEGLRRLVLCACVLMSVNCCIGRSSREMVRTRFSLGNINSIPFVMIRDANCCCETHTNTLTHKPVHLDVNECLKNNGGCDSKHLCINVPGSVTCAYCPDGYENDGSNGCQEGVCVCVCVCLHVGELMYGACSSRE